MRCVPRVTFLLSLLVTGLLLAVPRVTTAQPAPESAPERLVAELGHPDWQRRESATAKLRELDRAALPALRQAVATAEAHQDSDTFARIRTLLDQIETGIHPQMNRALTQAALGAAYAETPTERDRYLQTLMTTASRGPLRSKADAARVLARLVLLADEREGAAETRPNLNNLNGHAFANVIRFVRIDGSDEQAWQTALGAQEHWPHTAALAVVLDDADLPADAFAALRFQVARARADWERALETAPGAAERVSVLAEAGRWEDVLTAAGDLENEASAKAVQVVALLMLDRPADADALATEIAVMPLPEAQEGQPDPRRHFAPLHLLVGDPDRGQEMMNEVDPLTGFGLLRHRAMYDEAIDLAQEQGVDNPGRDQLQDMTFRRLHLEYTLLRAWLDSRLAGRISRRAQTDARLREWRAAREAMAGQDWPEAVRRWDEVQAGTTGGTDSAAAYFRALARARAGEADADDLQREALSRPLAQTDEQRELALLLRHSVGEEEAVDQLREAARLATSPDWSALVWWEAGRILADAGEFDEARQATAAAAVQVVLTQEADVLPELPLLVRYQLLRTRAGRAVEAGELAEAVALAERARQLMPEAIDVEMDLVPRLDAANRPDLAEAVFDPTFQAIARQLTQYEHSAGIRNKLAWLAARAGRRVDEVLFAANRAVALEGDNPAYIDTLAEVLSLIGRHEEARQRMDRVMTLARTPLEYEEFAARYEEVVSRDPNRP